LNRHVSFLSRVFWRIWFEFDRVHLEPARRDYLEYCFGTIISVNSRNRTLGYIPHYIWLGSQKSSASLDTVTGHALDVGKKNISAGVPLPSSFYQNHPWRKYYDDRLKKHTQFHGEYIYAFTREDSAVDHSILALSPEDKVLAITSAGDNILSYLRASPAKVHAVDLNPSQNHLLELKVAAYCSLPYEDFWNIFGEGKHTEFRSLLLSTLSPYLSSRALQFWITKCDTFEQKSGGLYDTGGSRHGIRLFHRVAGLFGFRGAIRDILREGQTLANQNETWQKRIRPYLLSSLLSDLVISQPRFLWTALGVPENQLAMMEKDHADSEAVGSYFSEHTRSHTIWEYMANTLDPVLKHDLIATQTPYYYVCLASRFSRACHPDYLTPETHAQLASPEAFRGLQIHTDEVQVVLASLPPASLTVAVLMDSMDWFAPGSAEATLQVEKLNRALKLGGRVMIRSAGLRPWYLDLFSCLGFRAVCEGAREKGARIDRVNMYASCWVMTKVSEP
jgi:betaine lipid synthase